MSNTATKQTFFGQAVAKLLADARKDAGVSWRRLAALTEISTGHLIDVLLHDTEPTAGDVYAITNSLGLDLLTVVAAAKLEADATKLASPAFDHLPTTPSPLAEKITRIADKKTKNSQHENKTIPTRKQNNTGNNSRKAQKQKRINPNTNQQTLF